MAISTLSSIEEASAGIACEEQGLLTHLLERDQSSRAVFKDMGGTFWDVKNPKSESLYGFAIFNKKNFFRSIKKEFQRAIKKNIIINISYLNDQDLAEAYEQLKLLSKEEIERIIVVDINNPEKSKKPSDLLNFLKI